MASVAGEVAILIEIAITPIFLFDFLYRLATVAVAHAATWSGAGDGPT